MSDSGGTGKLLLEDCVGGTGSEDPEVSRSGTNEAGDDPEADKKSPTEALKLGKRESGCVELGR